SVSLDSCASPGSVFTSSSCPARREYHHHPAVAVPTTMRISSSGTARDGTGALLTSATLPPFFLGAPYKLTLIMNQILLMPDLRQRLVTGPSPSLLPYRS